MTETRVFTRDEVHSLLWEELQDHWGDWIRVSRNYRLAGVFHDPPLIELRLDDLVLMDERDVQWFIDQIVREAAEG